MKHYPTYDSLDVLSTSALPNLHYGLRVQGNPRFHKFYFRVFWRGSPIDGPDFMETPPLAIKAARELMASLAERKEPYLVYTHRLYRGGVSIWNLNHPRFRDIEFAPAFDDDPDPETTDGYR